VRQGHQRLFVCTFPFIGMLLFGGNILSYFLLARQNTYALVKQKCV